MPMAHAVDHIMPDSAEIMCLLTKSKADVNVRGAVSGDVGSDYSVLSSLSYSYSL